MSRRASRPLHAIAPKDFPFSLMGTGGEKSITDSFGCVTVAEFNVAGIVLHVLEDDAVRRLPRLCQRSPARRAKTLWIKPSGLYPEAARTRNSFSLAVQKINPG